MTHTLESVVEDWSAAGCPRALPLDCLDWLEAQHRDGLAVLSAGRVISADIAPGDACDAVGLPRGAFWCEVAAELLDWVAPMPSVGERRLLAVSDALTACGLPAAA